MKLKEFRKDFDELRHKFSKTEIREYRKAFYDIKNYRNLSESEIKKISKKFNKLKKSLKFKKFDSNIDSVDFDDLDSYDDNYYNVDDDEYKKLKVLEHYLKSLIVIITNQ